MNFEVVLLHTVSIETASADKKHKNFLAVQFKPMEWSDILFLYQGLMTPLMNPHRREEKIEKGVVLKAPIQHFS